MQLSLPGVPGTPIDGPDMVDPEFGPATGTLSTTSKGRELADCGSTEAWTWSMAAFQLRTLAFQDQCGGAEPGDWPTLFRSR